MPPVIEYVPIEVAVAEESDAYIYIIVVVVIVVFGLIAAFAYYRIKLNQRLQDLQE